MQGQSATKDLRDKKKELILLKKIQPVQHDATHNINHHYYNATTIIMCAGLKTKRHDI